MLLLVMLCSMSAWAETLTVYDGTSNSPYLPVYGYYADAQGTTSEFVIPRGQLGAMEDGTISALTFYLSSSAAAAWTATFQVYLKEISTTTLTGITGPDASTVVYTGTLNAIGTEMTVTFSTPYTYNGNDLLIGTYVSEQSSNFPQANFYGVSQRVKTAYYKRGEVQNPQQFIPMTTFTYTPPSSVVPKPNNLAASNITPEQATISWSSDQDGWNIAWSTDPYFDPASATTHADNVSEKTYTITGLSQLTDYYVAVQNISNSKWSQILHFKTTAQPTAVGDGWNDDFEGTTCGWELINGELTNKWAWGTAANNGGTHALYISDDGGTNNTYSDSNTMVYAAKLLTFTEGTFEFSYDWRANGENNWDFLRAALIPGTESLTAGASLPSGFSYTSLPTGWIALDGGSQLNKVTEWQHKNATIDVAAGNYYLVFAWSNNGSGGNPPAAIDNVSVSKYPDEITDLAVSDVTATTATVSWNGNGDSYNARYRKQFFSEGFEGGSMPAGWTTDGPGTWTVGTGDSSTHGSHSGNYNTKITHSDKNNVTYLITPSMDFSGETSLKLSFWYVNRAWDYDKDGFGVYYRVGTDGAWTELWSTTEAHGSWTNQEVTLTGLAADYQLGFRMTDGYGYGVGLDDIQILTDWQTVNDITDKSTTLTGLDANTTYDCQVQSVKAGNTSLWSPIETFTTLKDFGTCTPDVPNPIYHSGYTHSYFYDGSWNDDHGGIKVYDGNTLLTYGTDYCFSMLESLDGGSCEKLGEHCRVTLVGMGDYVGTLTADVVIVTEPANGKWGDLKWDFADGTLTISKKDGVEGDVEMDPMSSTGDDYDSWLSIGSGIFSIVVEEGVKTIAKEAFGYVGDLSHHYGNLATISLPNSLKEIGEKAFAYCDGLTVDIDDVLAKKITLGDKVFYQIGCLAGSLANMADNTDVITLLDQAQRNKVTLKDRTLYKDGDWNTLTLPFALGNAKADEGHHFDGTLLEGATVMELRASESSLSNVGKLALNFTNALSIEAGKPYIVKWASGDNIVNPVFSGVNIIDSTPTPVEFNNEGGSNMCQFVGNFNPLEITNANRNSIVLLAAGNKLGYAKTDRTIANGKALGSCRAYFYVPENNGGTSVKEFYLNFGDEDSEDGIIDIENGTLNIDHSAGAVYNLSGQKLSKPQKGINIINGRKVLY